MLRKEDYKEINESSKFIDRKEENKDVLKFQETGDLNVLEKIYLKRIPTIRSWANKHYYPGLDFSVDDLFSELSIVFVKAAEKYDGKRGDFNTCLFTFLLNRLRNIKSSKHAKKRMSDEYEGPAVGMILSLDYSYGNQDEGELTLKDIIPDKEGQPSVFSNTYLEETLDLLSNKDPKLKEFLLKLGNGNSLVSLIKEYNTKVGRIKISPQEHKKIKSKRNVSKILKDKNLFNEGFKVLGYRIKENNTLEYKVELSKNNETDYFLKQIRNIRNNKDAYREMIANGCSNM